MAKIYTDVGQVTCHNCWELHGRSTQPSGLDGRSEGPAAHTELTNWAPRFAGCMGPA